MKVLCRVRFNPHKARLNQTSAYLELKILVRVEETFDGHL